MAQGSFEQIRSSILYNESLYKIEDGVNYGVDIGKLYRLLENGCKRDCIKNKSVRIGGI